MNQKTVEEGAVRRRLPVLAVLMIFATGAARAQSAPSDQTEQIRIVLERVQQLEKRVADLETKTPAPRVPAAEVAASIPAAPKPEMAEAAPSPGPVHQHEPTESQTTTRQLEARYPSLQIRGFGDVNFSTTDQRGAISGFNLGQLDLHLASALSHKVTYFGELTFNAQPTGYSVEVERSIIRYDYNDFFKLSFGKYHTPIGYWNAAFHHGAWLQTTIARPEMIKFGGTFIPTHFVGVEAEGNIPSGGLGLGYNIGLGNGRSSLLSKSGDSGDSNDNRSWVANVYARPARFYGLQLGASVYRDKLTPQRGQNFGEWITAADIVWTKEKPEFLAEYANVHHRNELTSNTWDSQAFYVQLAYRLPWQQSKWKPYYRFEYIHKPETDPTLLDVLDLSGSTVGVRYDITNYAAFKGEYRNSRHGVNEPRVNGAFFQTAFTF